MTIRSESVVVLQGGQGVGCRYRYDAAGVLVGILPPSQERWQFWVGGRVADEERRSGDATSQLTWLRSAGIPLVERVVGHQPRTSLLACGASGSVLLEAEQDVHRVHYVPHGHRSVASSVREPSAAPAFNGEMLDAASGCYLLGAGHHRPYSPTLGHFLAPDRAGPFGRGGLNTLGYCAGDPINRVDPTGHFWKWVIAAVGVVAGAIATVATFGAAAGAIGGLAAGAALTKAGAGAIAATTLGVASVGVESASLAAHAAGNEKLGGILGWVGVGIGAASLVAAVPTMVAKAATKGAAKLGTRQAKFTTRVADVQKASQAKGSSLMDDIIGLPGGSHQKTTVNMMRQSGAGRAAGGAPGGLYADAASASRAQQRGYPRFDELSRSGQANARAHARAYIQRNAYNENMFDFDDQHGLYNLVERGYRRWNPAPVSASSTRGSSREIPVNLTELRRHTTGAPPSYHEALTHPSMPTRPPQYDMGAPPGYDAPHFPRR